jgi:hypothetical protein
MKKIYDEIMYLPVVVVVAVVGGGRVSGVWCGRSLDVTG